MKKSQSLKIAATILIVLGCILIYLGALNGIVIIPPIITGIGFFVTAGIALIISHS